MNTSFRLSGFNCI